MIGKSFRREDAAEEGQTKGFDDFQLQLGDVMRGERATLKQNPASLLSARWVRIFFRSPPPRLSQQARRSSLRLSRALSDR